MGRYKRILVPELNLGQLRMLLAANYMVDAIGLNKIKGKPFAVEEVVEKIKALVSEIKDLGTTLK